MNKNYWIVVSMNQANSFFPAPGSAPDARCHPFSPAPGGYLAGSPKITLLLIFSLFYILLPQVANAIHPCGSLENPYGPFDYTNPTHFNEKLGIVENRHFTFDVESLKKGGSTGSLARDLDYTLRAFPNHHRALYAMARYQLRAKGKGDAGYTMECYFDRGIRMKQNDGIVWMLYGVYLHKKGHHKEALTKYKKAQEFIPEHKAADLHYNLGLLYIDIKQYGRANEHAQQAYELDYPLPGLRKQLKRLGAWQPHSRPAASPDSESTASDSQASTTPDAPDDL